MKIVFFGSDNFAATHLERLMHSGYGVVACVTQPDKARGRGLKVTVSPVKECAVSHGLPVFQPDDLKDKVFLQTLKNLQSDLFVVIAYGRKLPQGVLEIPRKFAINVHSSLLPKYRGAAPINWALINGEKETGITIIKVNERMDAGEIINQERIVIQQSDDAVTLKAKMALSGTKLLLDTLDMIVHGDYNLTPQDEHAVSLAVKLTKEMGHIQWQKKAIEIHNLVRGLLPWPSAYTFYKGKLLKIIETSVEKADHKEYSPGEVLAIDHDGFVVNTAQDALRVKKVHLQSSRLMDAKSFIAGHKISAGYKFHP